MAETLNLTCKAILFDMDGTLVDSTRVVEQTWGWWAKRHSIPLASVLAFSHGRQTMATLEYFLPGQDFSAELAELERWEESHFEGVVAVPGAIRLVEELQGQEWAIVTSAPRALAEARVRAVGLPLPQVVITADETSQSKPHPEGYLRAAELLGIAPEECLVFEDTRPGIEAGLRAGMKVVGLLTTIPAHDLAHSPLIRDFRDVALRIDGDSLHMQLSGHLQDEPVRPASLIR